MQSAVDGAVVTVGCRREWPPVLERNPTADLPSTHDIIQRTARRPTLARAERQFVDVAGYPAARDVKIAGTAPALEVAAILAERSVGVELVRGVIDRPGNGDRATEGEAGDEPAFDDKVQAVVGRVAQRVAVFDLLEVGVRQRPIRE